MSAHRGAVRALVRPPRQRQVRPLGRLPWRIRCGMQRRRQVRPLATADAGMLSLEAVLVLPVVALLVIGLLQTAAVVRDVLLVHEAARAGARAAAATNGTEAVERAVRRAAPELEVRVQVVPVDRGDGDVVTVRVSADRAIGPVIHTLRARAVARVEPVVRHPVGSGPP